MRPLRIALYGAGLLAAFGALAFVAGYLLAAGDYEVAATVENDPSLPRVELGGVTLHARAFGASSNRTVIVVHGGPGNDHRYLLRLKALADDHHVVFYDQRGSGLSQRVSPDGVVLGDLVDELKAVADHFAPGKAVDIIGHSWGAMLTTAFVGRYPERAERVVLAEPGFLTEPAATALMASTNNMTPPMSVGLLWLVTKLYFQSLHVDGPDDHARDDWFVHQIMTADLEGHPTLGYFCGQDPSTAAMEGWRFGARLQAGLFGSAFDEAGHLTANFSEGVEKFGGPVLMLTGSCNVLLGTSFQKEHHVALFENLELVEIADAGHTMFGEKPAESIALVRRFLRREAPAPGGTPEP